ncbi:MAG: HIT domain-containing protein [Thaumarchaeota archaeon]|nr:HIT domain-containing protein [Nitrososphaerota archaeon]MDE1840379.1 HIT domain-containing protein [Nitrososphaerota archaeon]MDE1878202.1 HIT domain-containing protein [Nitrososphaerota archaeon]
MIKTLLENEGLASVRKIAEAFLEKDQSQIEYYEQITRSMPGKVLQKHGIVDYADKAFVLNVSDLTSEQRSELIELCNQKIKEYENKRGRLIWKHRARDSREVPGSLRYQVLSKAKFRCELCGISADEKALDVDHIVPVNKGGKTIIENLQALCHTCNSQKRDLDDTDFRPWKDMYRNIDPQCVFCKIQSKSYESNELAFVLEDKYPVTKYHTLILPKRHVRSFFELSSSEQKACLLLLESIKEKISKKDSSINGFNIGINDGHDAGQTIFHCHIHLIPRRKGDVPNPEGGIRHVIPEKGFYK